MTGLRDNLFLCFLLVAITVFVYWQVCSFEFVHYDDDIYVTANDHVTSGLRIGNLRWALTAAPNGDWIPLTWLSSMVDHELSRQSTMVVYGGREDPSYYHRTSLLLHMANTLLLFAVLNALTGLRWRSAMVAAVFGVHPLHVESVAWIASRKDVLSTFFMLLTIWTYWWYTRNPVVRRYLLVMVLLVLGLMSKSILMTLPFVLLLLDFWPLRRLAGRTGDKDVRGRTWRQLVLEKIPLLAICAAAGVVAVFAQMHGQALGSLDKYPMGVRVSNAVVSYVAYLWKMIWPVDLACFYQHPGATIPVWQVVGSGVLLVVMSLAVLRVAGSRPYLSVGWLWYLATLFPAIGIVQFGYHAMADRFTYIPLTGVFIAIIWGVCELLPQRRGRNLALAILAASVVLPLSLRARDQAASWRDSETLFTHAIRVTANNSEACRYLANALDADGRTDEAIQYFLQAERLDPDDVRLPNNLGVAHFKLGNIPGARRQFERALRLDKDCVEALCNLAALALCQGNLSEAARHAQNANRIAPGSARVRNAIAAVESARHKAAPKH